MADVEADPSQSVLLLIVTEDWSSSHLCVLLYEPLHSCFLSMEVVLLITECIQLALSVL